MLQLSRRTILKMSIAAVLVLSRAKTTLAGLIDILHKEQEQLHENPTLRALIESLIPADETPSALEVGVLEKIVDKAGDNPKYAKMLRKGCQWLDMQARKNGSNNFSKLTEYERNSLLERAATENSNTHEYMFFSIMRYDAFYFYYAKPTTWQTLNYPGPPQPKGFRDYTQPPKRILQ